MKAFAADLGLTFEPGEVVVCELLVPGVLAGYNHPFHGLSQQKLMMEGDKSAFVPERKNDPYSHVDFSLLGKKSTNNRKKSELRIAKVLKIRHSQEYLYRII